MSIRNYKSIAECDVELGKFNVIVGRNGSGKSNFLDAIRFVAESLDTSLDHAVRARGGFEDVLRRTDSTPIVLAIELQFGFADGRSGTYAIELGWLPQGRFRVQRELLDIKIPGRDAVGFETRDGEVTQVTSQHTLALDLASDRLGHAWSPSLPKPAADRLYLVALSGLSEFREVYDALTLMHTYNVIPEQIRKPHPADAAKTLRRDGSNLGSIVSWMFANHQILITRVQEYLHAVVPQITAFGPSSVDGYDSLNFYVGELGTTLHASSMSDGTLRTLGNLIAAMQLVNYGHPLSVVGIEEPEASLHPAATRALVDGLREAAVHSQVIVTSHSADLLDSVDFETDMLLVAEMVGGVTVIGPIDAASASVITDHLYTAGDLLRIDQLQPRSRQASKHVLQPATSLAIE